ncbi:unnamed protein product [Rotaria sp. Silwood2]|nr:unnamed protein product [Rotaria sp. Silwood2]CAF3161097.1 unnamed protein product [Rotaria sp. Silwood2]CAF3453721.1 unnamed protein product [Rotaria sp. Silwood2]CAF4504456.1 unnamed protein product [Rotaria sp. Silwood2]CAF4541691.1 unnamed protein product [Rotaria sp. Silwood2]
MLRLFEEGKRSLKKRTDTLPIDLIQRTVKETLITQNESSTTLEQIEQKLVQTIEREIQKVQSKMGTTRNDEPNEKRDNDEKLSCFLDAQKQVLTDALNRLQQQAMPSSLDLIKQVVAETLNRQREQLQPISRQDIERLERNLTETIQRELKQSTEIDDDIDTPVQPQDIHKRKTEKRNGPKNDNEDTLNRLFTEQRQALRETLAQHQSTVSLNLIKRALMEVLSEQSDAETTKTTNTVSASRHRKRMTTTTNHEVPICADPKQTRIGAAYREQRDAVVAKKHLRDAVKQWSNVATMSELVSKIKACGKNDLEKAWLLFCWIGLNIRYDSYCRNNAAESVFQQRTGVCRGFVSLYHECCSLLSIECLEISGYTKQAFLKPGEDLKSSPHAWNAIVIDQYTYLLDPTWGAGGLDKTNELEDFYFLTSPEELIYTHYCNGHQLLNPELRKEEFLSLPVMKSTYYRLNLNLLSPKQGFNETSENLFKIAIRTPEHVDIFADLHVGDEKYPRNLHTLCQRDEKQADVLNCYIAPPSDGLYEISIFAKTKGETTFRDTIHMRLHVSNFAEAITFPLTYQPFTEHQCILIEPRRRLVHQDESVLIHMKIPGANVIKIRNGDDYIVPTKDEYKNGVLKKETIVQGDISVCGRWDDKADSISTICVFNMI